MRTGIHFVRKRYANRPESKKGLRHRRPFRYQTASLAALTGRARTILRAGLALNIISSPVKGLVPLRALVAGFLTTTNLAKPGTRNTPFFLSSLWPTSTSASITPLTSFFETSVDVAIFSISCDLDIWVAMFAPLILEEARYGGNCLKKQGFRHSAQLYRKLTCTDSREIGQFLGLRRRIKRFLRGETPCQMAFSCE